MTKYVLRMTKYVVRLIHAVTRRGEVHESSTSVVVGVQHEEESVNIPANPGDTTMSRPIVTHHNNA
ncbi:MAG: hypothetical protein U9R47_11425, partial [Actinomycetota bacterium]|nr:hypothetical protein [Actinomycetota bacterium]